MAWPKGKPRGEKTAGSGRKIGTPNKSSLPIAEMCDFHNCSPLEAMIKFCSHQEDSFRFQAAKELLNYLYPKKTAQSVTLENFSLEEIEAFVKAKIDSAPKD